MPKLARPIVVSAVKKNTLANYAGQAWAAVVGIIFVPVYIRYIGIEAYGIIGFFVAIQSLLTILDFGVSATLNRELARRSGDPSFAAADTRDLVRSLEWICWPTAALIALVVWAISGPAAEYWLRPSSFSAEQAAQALFLLGVGTALQWPASFYTGGLAGLQRQVLLNVLVAIFATARAGGAVLVLMLVSPTLEAFLWWQIVMSAVQSAVFATVTWHALPRGKRAPSFSFAELRRVGRFALGIAGVTVLSFLLTSSDRIVLSKILPLDEFGVYAFAATVAAALLRLVHPIVMAVYPRYSQLVAAGDHDRLIDFYHRTNQVVSATVLPVAAVTAMFAGEIILLWTADRELSAAAAPILALLVAGSALNGLMNLPYALQLAYGWTSLSFWINVVAVCVLVPATWVMGMQLGGVGAAAVWLALNFAYMTIGIPLMHRRLLRTQMRRWYLSDIALPLGASSAAALGWRMVLHEVPEGWAGWGLILVVLLTSAAFSVAVTPFPRGVLGAWWIKLRRLAT